MNVSPDDRAPRDSDPAGYDVPRDDTARRDAPLRDDHAPRTADADHRTAADRVPEEPAASGSKTAAIWVALILGAIVLILLLIFVIQNSTRAAFEYFSWTFQLPLGVAMLLAAIAGALVMALVGSVRMIQQSMQLRRMRKNQEALRSLVGSR